MGGVTVAANKETSKHRLALLRKRVRETEARCARLRELALCARMSALMCPRTRRGYRVDLISREDLAGEWEDAKRWRGYARRDLALEEKKEIVIHGGRWSPRAVERNFPNGAK